MNKFKNILTLGTGLLAGTCFVEAESEAFQPARADRVATPRIVNIYNFVRNSDYRLANSEAVLFEATRQEIQLIKPTGLPATWALQYDALINPSYQKLFKEQLGTNDEIAAWWEIPRPLAEKAGLKWRGHDHEWDSTANVGFSPGYTPDERRKLVDVYMADFKAIFGYYPRTVGSWFIDEVTLAYMAERYDVVASCNCKDQIGTDGYTLWGGYWNQAYYPSKLNAYMPAQTKAGQIDVPIFRMLGSDPIYQYGDSPGMWTLEPVYPKAGGSADWVAWFMNQLIHQPALAFGYTQAGQENSFGWEAMKTGLTLQIELLARQARAGEIQVMTLAQAGEWFRDRYSLTPSTAVVALDDWKQQGRKTVWYNSRFYRLNILWENGAFYIRDLHRFDENVASVTHDRALTKETLAYGTLPVMDGALWHNDIARSPMGTGLNAAVVGCTNVTALAAAMVTNNRLNFVVGNRTLGGDPAYGLVKTFQITFKLGGTPQTLSFAEDSTVDIGAPGQTLTIINAIYGHARREPAGIWPVLLLPDGTTSPMIPDGPPVVKEANPTDLRITQNLRGGGNLVMLCRETNVTFTGVDGQGNPLNWAWDMVGGRQQSTAVQSVSSNVVAYHFAGASYQLRLAPGVGSCEQLGNGAVRLRPNRSGKLVVMLGGY